MANYSFTSPVSTTAQKFNNLTVTSAEPNDVFRISISETRNLNLNLTDIKDGDADLRLYRDNGDGVYSSSDPSVESSIWSSNQDDYINRQVTAGTYWAVVNRFSSSSPTVRYDLFASATPLGAAPNLMSVEFGNQLGDLSASVSRSGSINNNNVVDNYAFSLGLYEGVNITLSGLSANANVRIVEDDNGDRIVNAGEQVIAATNAGSVNDVISNFQSSGNYLLQVYQGSSGVSTNYSLNLGYFASSTP